MKIGKAMIAAAMLSFSFLKREEGNGQVIN
jgi:hypothetical protein